MRLVLVTPPAVEPLTAAEAKARLNIGDEVSDEVMNAYIMAARQRIDGADGYLGRALNTQTLAGPADTFPTVTAVGSISRCRRCKRSLSAISTAR